jgi:hypothetical protein
MVMVVLAVIVKALCSIVYNIERHASGTKRFFAPPTLQNFHASEMAP